MEENGRLLASWSFPHLIRHWTAKHNQACYVRYKKINPVEQLIEFDPEILLCEGTNAMMLLKAIEAGFVFLDPACRESKARNQFRTGFSKLFALYEFSGRINLANIN